MTNILARRLEEWGDMNSCLNQLESSRTELLLLVAQVDDETMFRQPNAESWSAILTMEHIARVEESVARAIRWTRRKANGEEMRSVAVSPGTLRSDGRAVAPDMVAPRGEWSRQEVIDALAASRRNLIAQAQESSSVLDNPASLGHPFFGELNGLGWLQMATYHERHHIEQVRTLVSS